jgi:hypothetical protein
MNSVVALCAITLAAAACGRSERVEHKERTERTYVGEGRGAAPPPSANEPVGQTQTTGAEVEKDKQARADLDKARQDALEEGKQTGKAECEAKVEKEKADRAAAAKKAKDDKAKKEKKAQETSSTKEETKDHTEPVGSTTITGAPLPGTPGMTGAIMPMPAPAPTEQPNRSTTLGDSTSGEYTGGKGTYGGTATWGTGTKK